MCVGESAVIRTRAIGDALVGFYRLLLLPRLLQTEGAQVRNLRRARVHGARESHAAQLVARRERRRPVGARNVEAQSREDGVRLGRRSSEARARSLNPRQRVVRASCLAQRVNDVEEGVVYALARGEALCVLRVARGCFAGSVQAKERRGDVIEAVAARGRRRVRVAEFLEDGQRLLVSALLEERSTDAEVCGGHVRVCWIARDECAPVRARLLECAVRLIDGGATHVLLRRELRRAGVRRATRPV